ncbi:MAG: YceI family protein [Verrucomicrobium sp.]|nr:YceI family protein [Verrucomicrobium sp.]
MPQIIDTPTDLESLRQQQPDLILLDVRLSEDYEEGHLPGAVNQCVYEVAFLGEVPSHGVRRDQAVCVYGVAPESHESAVAAAKLERAGYNHVFDFRGGLEAWRAEGRSLEAPATLVPAAAVKDGRFPLDLKESKVVWVGRNLINHHWGHVQISEGHVVFENGQPVSGAVIVDLREITCADLAGGPLHDVLIHHLESDDFFDVENHPEAQFVFDKVEVCAEAPGCHNLKLLGDFTMRGQTHAVTVVGAAGYTPDGHAAMQATLILDRTQWGVVYGSGRFFHRLASHLVNDHIELQLRILTLAAVRNGVHAAPATVG